jgi:hypothetical protein
MSEQHRFRPKSFGYGWTPSSSDGWPVVLGSMARSSAQPSSRCPSGEPPTVRRPASSCFNRKHRLDGRSPGMQAQTVETALELLKPFDHQSR